MNLKDFKGYEETKDFLDRLMAMGIKNAQIIIGSTMFGMTEFLQIAIGNFEPNPSFLRSVLGLANKDVVYIIVPGDPASIHGNPDRHLRSVIEQVAEGLKLEVNFHEE